MSKRFTATEKWLDPWFCNLNIVDRLFWIYLCDNCDHSGIWQVNMLLVKTYFPGYEPKTESFGDRVQLLSQEKWYLTKFVEFQYGNLNPKNRVHASILKKVEKEGASKGLTRGLLAPKDMDMDKDVVEVKKLGDGVEGVKTSKVLEWFEATWKAYPKERRVGKKAALRSYQHAVKTLDDAHRFADALENYLKSKTVRDGFIKNASTFFANSEDYADERRDSQRAIIPPIERQPNPTGEGRGGFSSAQRILSGLTGDSAASDEPQADVP